MSKLFILFAFIISYAAVAPSVTAQKQLDPQVARDPVLEADANHNLEVAQNYFRTRKAYRAVLLRFEETYAAYPEYSKMDEFLYIAGMSSLYLSENKGKQKLADNASEDEKKKYAPEKLKVDAIEYFTTIVDKFPQSKYKSEAEKMLKQLKPE